MLDDAKNDKKSILTAEVSWLLRIAGVTRLHEIRNGGIRQALGRQTIVKVVERRLRWFGHGQRIMSIDRIPHHNALYYAKFEKKETKADPDYDG